MMAPASAIKGIDIAVVAYYRPWPFTFLRCRKFFRFEGRNDGAKLNWYKQPPGDIDQSFDAVMKAMKVEFP